MCGIAGVISRDPSQRSDALLRGMLTALEHRGPDDEGVEIRGDAALGARRLAIIDLAGGHQPMTNEDGSIIAVQNGEIYNFMELRAELEARGHRFRTRNDTEVLLRGYEEWGEGVVERLRGMFAIAIWDDRRRALLLARDRFGKKPLFYATTNNVLIFASELQGVLAHPAIRGSVDDEAIDEYLTYGYVPAPRTGFAEIRKVRPAHFLIASDGDIRERRYWQLPFVPKLDISIDDAATELRRLIAEAVRIRLISDVPIGAFLSGGLDSSTVVAEMAMQSSHRVSTFSVGFRARQFDESPFAREVAQAFHTEHHELVVDVDDIDVLPKLVRHLGEPFADSSIVPSYHVARATRQHVTVALNGDGGDELFAGYDRYRAAAIPVDSVPRSVRRGAAAVASLIPRGGLIPRPVRRAARFLAAAALPPEERFLRLTGYFTGSLREAVAGEKVRRSAPQTDLLGSARTLTGAIAPSEQYMAGDILMNLPNDLLVKMDIATMANSLEGRSPLLDHRLAEFVARLPVTYKVSPFSSKILLRRAMAGILPPRILRRGKWGFMAPVGHWFRGPLRPLFEETVLSQRATERGYVSTTGARHLFDEHVSGRADMGQWLWSLLMLELWFRELVDLSSPAAKHHPAAAHV